MFSSPPCVCMNVLELRFALQDKLATAEDLTTLPQLWLFAPIGFFKIFKRSRLSNTSLSSLTLSGMWKLFVLLLVAPLNWVGPWWSVSCLTLNVRTQPIDVISFLPASLITNIPSSSLLLAQSTCSEQDKILKHIYDVTVGMKMFTGDWSNVTLVWRFSGSFDATSIYTFVAGLASLSNVVELR